MKTIPVEFMCVLSVGGSLATYRLRQENRSCYSAVLRTTGSKRTDVPAEMLLEKTAAGWSGTPPHEEILRGLANAIEAKGNLTDER